MRMIDADAFERDLTEHVLPILIQRYGEEEAIRGLHFSYSDCISNISGQPTIEERKSTIEFPHVFIAEGYDSIKSEDGETGFGIYDPENKQIFIAGDVPNEIFVKALLHELMHWVQDISGCAFNEGEANTFAENIYNTMESYIVTNRWIPCSERLPEKCKEVLVCYDFKGHRSVLIGTLYGDESFHGYDDEYLTPEGRKYRKAVAWMPLPEPYKSESEG